jgi:hypothetical protein
MDCTWPLQLHAILLLVSHGGTSRGYRQLLQREFWHIGVAVAIKNILGVRWLNGVSFLRKKGWEEYTSRGLTV